MRKAKYRTTRALRYISSTGSVLLPETAEYFHAVLPGTKLSSGSGGATAILLFFYSSSVSQVVFSYSGTELNGSLALANPLSPTYAGGELPGPPLGLDVDVVDPVVSCSHRCICVFVTFAVLQTLERVVEREGELACFSPAPNMPLHFVGDKDKARYRASYFGRSRRVWLHGDYSVRTARGGFFILGRSDATLNPGGVRIGTRDYYSAVEQVPGVRDAVAVGVPNADGDEDVALFTVLDPAADRDKVGWLASGVVRFLVLIIGLGVSRDSFRRAQQAVA